MRQFAAWLGTTAPSTFIQVHYAWALPALHAVHLVGIALVIGSALIIDLRILGLAWMDQTFAQTTDRFIPWLFGSLGLLLATGLLMVVGEPTRELVTFSFWLKMTLVAIGAAATWRLQRRPGRTLAIVTLVLWACIVGIARLIAYDYVWGAWSPNG
jgi:hypothetical protein